MEFRNFSRNGFIGQRRMDMELRILAIHLIQFIFFVILTAVLFIGITFSFT
jgi:hypothetical protein